VAAADANLSLTPDDIAGQTFSTHFRGYDAGEVKDFLQSVADAHRALLVRVAAAEATEAKAAELVSAAEVRAAELLREAQDEARRIVEAVAGEREKAFAEGASRAEAVIAQAEERRQRIEDEARLEGERLIAEAKGARHRVLDDLRRRRRVSRAQVEQLNAARERLLTALAEVRSAIDATTTGLRDVLPEVKAAADAAARRVGAEDETTIEQLEAEIDALKLAGLSLVPAAAAAAPIPDQGVDERGAEGELGGEADATSSPDDEEPPEQEEPEEPPTFDRRSSSVRIVRPMRSQDPETGLPEEELVPLEAPDPDEAVRIVGAGEFVDAEALDRGSAIVEQAPVEPVADRAAEPEAEPEPEPERPELPDGADEPVSEQEQEEPEEPDEGRPTQAAVDALFARLKAGRDDHPADAPAPPEPAAAPVVEDADAAEPETEPGSGDDEPVPSAAEALLARRDATLAPATKALNRHLKRLLADEQNELLDRLRREGPKAGPPSAAEHDSTWAEAASSELALAAAAGAAFPGLDGPVKQPSPDDLVAVAEALADAIARPLRDRLGQVLADAEGDGEVAGDGVRATYRTWRAERLSPAVDHAVLDAFGLGVSVAFGSGTPVSWLADDGGVSCPDCDDDALAGALPCGEAFPTGHRRPPAHPGCRCLLVAPDALPGA
jgi:DivIVA domain-containing protein